MAKEFIDDRYVLVTAKDSIDFQVTLAPYKGLQ
jgi:hypothetical protein